MKVLGLDIGTTSIGWAFIQQDEKPENSSIVRAGVKIIPLTTEEQDEFIKGQRQTKNAQRRLKRSMRRNLQRYKLRRRKLVAILRKHGMMPEETLLLHPDKLEIYGLRVKALTEKISLQELGRIFYHLNQKRGYKSNRRIDEVEEAPAIKTAQDDASKKKEGYLESIERRSEELEQQGKTIGQAIYEELKKNPHYRVKSSENANTVYLRENYEKEFDRIWEKQAEFHIELTSELKRQIKDEAIYYQRRLKSQKHLVSKCRYEPNFRVCPRSSPFHQIRRMWQDINHLRVIDKHGEIIGHLSEEQRKLLFEALWNESDLKPKKILEILGYKGGKLNLPPTESGDEAKSLRGFTTLVKLRKALQESGVTNPEQYLQFEYQKYIAPIDPECKKDPIAEPLYGLWHHLYSFDGTPEKLTQSLMKKYNFSREQARALVKVHFEGDYSSLSAKATRRILPFLIEGKVYSEACEAVYGKHADYLSKEEEWMPQELRLLKRNSLRNPVVERILNHLINLVNAIIADPELGRPDEIHVELARELKMNVKKRKKISDENANNEKRRKKIEEILRAECNILRPTRDDVVRYKLWEEFGNVCPYEPGKVLSITEAFSGSYEIDHIIPQSRLFDDSYMNKALAPRHYNAAKGNSTAYDYMQTRSQEDFEAYKRLIEKSKTIPEAKKKKLLMSAGGIPEDFIARQLRETAFITKEALKLLKKVCHPDNVISTSGSITDFLRQRWGMNTILKYLNKERYEALGRVTYVQDDESGRQILRIKDWSKRDDHRHHAVDAIVVAATSRSAINSLSRLNQDFESYAELKNDAPYFGPFWTEQRRRQVTVEPDGSQTLSPSEKQLLSKFRKDAEHAIASILISFKTGKRISVKNKNSFHFKDEVRNQHPQPFTPRGFLHKATIYGKIKMRDSIKLTPKFDVADLERVTKPRIRKLVEDRLAAFGNSPKKAFKDLAKNPIWYDEAKKIPLTFIPVWREQFVVKKDIDVNFKQAEKIVDLGIKRIIEKRLAQYDGNPKEAFKDLMNNPIWLNKEAGIAIRSVRIIDNQEDLVPLHRDEKTGKPKDYAAARNNHHVAIYRKPNGEFEEEVVTFWDAFNRKVQGEEIINRHPADGREFLFSMQVNEMFVFGLEPERITDPKNYPEVSKHLYRVQKLTSGDYVFRHHLATTLEDDSAMLRITSLKKLNCIKVKVANPNRLTILPIH